MNDLYIISNNLRTLSGKIRAQYKKLLREIIRDSRWGLESDWGDASLKGNTTREGGLVKQDKSISLRLLRFE